MGLIACIVSAVKGHKTFAIAMGVWTIIAIILLVSGFQYAYAPGPLFLLIAICMKKKNKDEGKDEPYSQQLKTSKQSLTTNGFSSEEEAIFVHNAIANGATFDDAKADFNAHHTSSNQTPLRFDNGEISINTDKSIHTTCDATFFHAVDDSLTNTPSKQIIATEGNDSVKLDVANNALPVVLYCRKCGFKLLAGSNYCNKCGTKVEY